MVLKTKIVFKTRPVNETSVITLLNGFQIPELKITHYFFYNPLRKILPFTFIANKIL